MSWSNPAGWNPFGQGDQSHQQEESSGKYLAQPGNYEYNEEEESSGQYLAQPGNYEYNEEEESSGQYLPQSNQDGFYQTGESSGQYLPQSNQDGFYQTGESSGQYTQQAEPVRLATDQYLANQALQYLENQALSPQNPADGNQSPLEGFSSIQCTHQHGKAKGKAICRKCKKTTEIMNYFVTNGFKYESTVKQYTADLEELVRRVRSPSEGELRPATEDFTAISNKILQTRIHIKGFIEYIRNASLADNEKFPWKVAELQEELDSHPHAGPAMLYSFVCDTGIDDFYWHLLDGVDNLWEQEHWSLWSEHHVAWNNLREYWVWPVDRAKWEEQQQRKDKSKGKSKGKD